jgi:hypothetical protein
MQCEAPDKRFFGELRDLNAEFLALVTHPAAGEPAWRLLGLSAATGQELCGLNPQELEFVTAVPGLLADFRRLPPALGVFEPSPLPAALNQRWLQQASVFAAGLLTYLWQLAQRERLLTTLCLGPGNTMRGELRAVGFRDIQHCARNSVAELRARFGSHPTWWPELLTAARSEDHDERSRCRLDLIALGLAADAGH